MNILFDSLSTQVMYQQKPAILPPGVSKPPFADTGLRLNTVLGAIASIGFTNAPWVVSYSQYPITAAQLGTPGTATGIDVYVSFTRYPATPYAYLQSELDALQTWVGDGGNILLLSNHGPLQGNSFSWPANDIPLASQFGITIQAYGVSDPGQGWMNMSLASGAPSYIGYQVSAIQAHDSCIINTPTVTYTSLAVFPSTAKMYKPPQVEPLFPNFAILVPYLQGSVIVVGNSGMFADYGTPNPSCGLAPMANNLLFFLNCLGYFAGWGVPPAPGKCPQGS